MRRSLPRYDILVVVVSFETRWAARGRSIPQPAFASCFQVISRGVISRGGRGSPGQQNRTQQELRKGWIEMRSVPTKTPRCIFKAVGAACVYWWRCLQRTKTSQATAMASGDTRVAKIINTKNIMLNGGVHKYIQRWTRYLAGTPMMWRHGFKKIIVTVPITCDSKINGISLFITSRKQHIVFTNIISNNLEDWKPSICY